MKRLVKVGIILFLAVSAVVFAAALAGGLMDERAFTPEAKNATH